MPELSPAAQAVMDAVEDDCIHPSDKHRLAADVIRAAADHVVPEAANAVGDEHDEARLDQWLRIRWRLLSIAAELDSTTTETTDE